MHRADNPDLPSVFSRLPLVVGAIPDRIRADFLQALETFGFEAPQIGSDRDEIVEILRSRMRVLESRPPMLTILDREMIDDGLLDVCRRIQAAGLSAAVMIVDFDDRQPDMPMPETCLVDRVCFRGSVDNLASRAALLARLALSRREEERRYQQLQNERAHHKVIQSRLEHLTYHDDLTGLFNRRRLEHDLEKSAHRVGKDGRTDALLYIDIDNFKVINDAEGHAAGDRFLASTAQVLHEQQPEGATLARLSADEFGLLIPGADEHRAREVAENIRAALDGFEFQYLEGRYSLSASIGALLIGREDAQARETLLGRAHQACFGAKEAGRNQVMVFSSGNDTLSTLRDDRRWTPVIRDALRDNRLLFHYQPIVRLSDGVITHFETLIRLQTEDGEIHRPGAFIPVAERTGLITRIDGWVARQAIDLLADLSGQHEDTGITINLSAHAFQNSALHRLIDERLRATGIDPRRLVLEITETNAITNFETVRETVLRLRSLGCRVALDDFGAGFNSFRYLRELPVDYLKLDGSFISNLNNDPADQVLVRSMTEIARALGKQTIAEFVDSPALLPTLEELGVDHVQGNFIGPAAPRMVRESDLPAELDPVNESARLAGRDRAALGLKP